MPIASPTVQIAALAAFNSPQTFVASSLFPRCPVPGAAMKPGTNRYEGKAYRAAKNQNRVQPGELSLEMQPGVRPKRIYSTLEDYDLSSQPYWVDTPISKFAAPTMGRFGVENYQSQIVTPLLTSALLQDREYRAAAVIGDTANFGDNVAGNWADDTVDPIEQLDVAVRTIELGFGALEPFHTYLLMCSDDAFRALRNNPKFRARFRITEDTPVTPDETADLIGKVLTLESGARFQLRVAKATASAGNEGQTPSMGYIIANKACLVVTAPASSVPLTSIEAAEQIASRAATDLTRRTWGRGYSMLDPTISVYEDDATNELIYRATHATTDALYDATGGYLFTAPASGG